MSSRILGRVASFVTKRARLVVSIWALLVIALAFQGRGLEKKLAFHELFVDGTPSKRAHEIALREFGSNDSVVVMLRGPSRQVDRQGRRLAEQLNANPRFLVVSPWARGGTIEDLRPAPGVAALLVHFEGAKGDAIPILPPSLQHRVDAGVTAPVHASIAGFPVVVNSIHNAGKEATKLGELIAVPILLLVLMLVFRSVVAALLPLVVGGAVVIATTGLLGILSGIVELDLFAVAVTGMMGLALGVDYSLLVVSRFRERAKNGDAAEIAEATAIATARSVVPAGSGLCLAMLVSAFLVPGVTTRSVAIAVVIAATLSVLSAICIVPAMLTLLGDNLERWSLPRRRASRVAPVSWMRRLASRPRAVIAITFVLLILSGWAFALSTATTTIALLPPGDPGRQQQEEVEDTLGPGWAAPMEVIVDGRGSPVTSPTRLRAFAAFQRHIERDPGVQSVAGLAPIERGTRQLTKVEQTLVDQERGLDRLETGISRVHHGANLTVDALRAAARGSQGLDSGLGAAHTGAGVLASALQQTSMGSNQLTDGLGRANEGSGQLASGTTKVSGGAGQLANGLEKAREKTGELTGSSRLFKNAMQSGDERLAELHTPLRATEAQLMVALQALQRMSTGKSDPEYAAALRAVEEAGLHLNGTDPATGEQADPAYDGVYAGVERAESQFEVGLYLAARLDHNGREASKGIGKLARASERLDRGLRRLAAASQRVSDGIAALDQGGEKLSPALQRIGQGAQHLTGGLTLLKAGSGRLADGLGTGAQKSSLLSGGLDRIETGLARQRGPSAGGSQLNQLQQRSPGLFKSSYFVLASLDGSHPQQRGQLGFLINLDRGGTDARMLVIPSEGPTSAATVGTKERLEKDSTALARQTGTEVVVGGVSPNEIEVNDTIRRQALVIRLALSLVTMLILIPVMRSLTIPLLAAVINAITVSASLGALSLLFDHSLLGGPGYVDTTTILTTMMVMFGLAIDYEVFVFARMREEYVRTGSPSVAVKNGLDHTAHIVTGAAVIMISIFLAFSVSEFMSMRSFGVALAIAVAIDAFIVRLILVPAAMNRLGKWSWWMPKWLDRLLPGGSSIPAGGERSGAA